MVYGVKISGVDTPALINEAVSFLGLHLIMLDEFKVKALQIPDFIFYSKSFKNLSPSQIAALPFTVTLVDIPTDKFYINISGHKLEVPINTFDDFKILPASHYILFSEISNGIKETINLFVFRRFLFVIEDEGGLGDFNNDFNFDFD